MAWLIRIPPIEWLAIDAAGTGCGLMLRRACREHDEFVSKFLQDFPTASSMAVGRREGESMRDVFHSLTLKQGSRV